MKRNYLRGHTPVFVALWLVASPAASAQETAATVELRSRWGGQVGDVEYGTGDYNCPDDSGLTFGAEVRTRGVWLGAMGVDLFYTGELLCEQVLRHLIFRGEDVTVNGRTRLGGASRLRARVGRTLTIGGNHVEPALGVAMIHTDSFWNAWVGGSVTLRPSELPVGLELEYGVHQVRFSYQALEDGEVVREFRRWKPLFRVSLVR